MLTPPNSRLFHVHELPGSVYKDPRKPSEKLFYISAYNCTGCDTRIHKLRPPLAFLRFVFSKHTCCPACGADWVRPAAPEESGGVSKHPLSFIQQFRRAPRFVCMLCGTLYYDSH